MEELSETFQDEMGFPKVEDDGPEENEEKCRVAESQSTFNTPEVQRFEEPLANLLNEQHRTVKELLEQLKMKKSSSKQQQEVERVKPKSEKVPQTLVLDLAQRKRLQQQMQQHVQLLTQIHLLASSNPSLSSEASTTRVFLKELETMAKSSISLHHQCDSEKLFQACNLMGALQLIEDFSTHVNVDSSLCITVQKPAHEFPCLPKQVAWILATNKVFMYPELLPLCSLQAKDPEDKSFFTKAEDNLLALGLKHFECTEFPKPLISKYLLTCKTVHQLTRRIKNLNLSRAPDNIVKLYKKTKQLPVLVKCCEEVQPHQWKPPVEREEHRLPFWLKASLPSIQKELRQMAEGAGEAGGVSRAPENTWDPGLNKGSSELESEARYPLLLPKGVVLKLKPVAKRFSRKAWRQKRSSGLKPLLIRPSPSLQPSFSSGKTPARSTQSETPPSKTVDQFPHPIQTVSGVPALEVSGGHGCDSSVALPEARTGFPVNSAPAPQITLPSLAPSKFRKPCVKRRPPKRKGTKASPCVKPAPFIHPAPVIFTVPATTVKVVSLSTGCNVIQPVNATVAQSPQTIPIATLLVNPTSFPCPLNQPLVAFSIPPLIVAGNSVNLHVPPAPEDKAQGSVDLVHPLAEGKGAIQGLEPKVEPQESSLLGSPVLPKEEQSPRPLQADGCLEELSENCTYHWMIVKTEEGGQALEAVPQDLEASPISPFGDVEKIVKVEPEDPRQEISSGSSLQDICGQIKEESSMELDTSSPSEGSNWGREVKLQPYTRRKDITPISRVWDRDSF